LASVVWLVIVPFWGLFFLFLFCFVIGRRVFFRRPPPRAPGHVAMRAGSRPPAKELRRIANSCGRFSHSCFVRTGLLVWCRRHDSPREACPREKGWRDDSGPWRAGRRLSASDCAALAVAFARRLATPHAAVGRHSRRPLRAPLARVCHFSRAAIPVRESSFVQVEPAAGHLGRPRRIVEPWLDVG